MNLPQDLHIGDTLLYGTLEIEDQAIEWKEGEPLRDPSSVAHVEVYAGNGQSWASRNGIGVGLYPFRPGPVHIRRLTMAMDLPAVLEWFKTVNGAPYGWGDIAASMDIGLKLPGMDCSHFAAALYDAGNCPQFDTSYPRNKITPRDFKLTMASYDAVTA